MSDMREEVTVCQVRGKRIQCVGHEGRGYSVSGQREEDTVCQVRGKRLQCVRYDGKDYSVLGMREEEEDTVCQV